MAYAIRIERRWSDGSSDACLIGGPRGVETFATREAAMQSLADCGTAAGRWETPPGLNRAYPYHTPERTHCVSQRHEIVEVNAEMEG